MNKVILFAVGMGLIELTIVPTTCLAQSYTPCNSIRESKARGCYLSPVSIDQSAIVWKGKEIKIKEAWLEQAHERSFLRTKKASHYNLCFILSTGWDVLWDRQGPFFVLEKQKGRGFGMKGSVVLWTTLDAVDSDEYSVMLTDNWKYENAIRFRIKLAGFVAKK